MLNWGTFTTFGSLFSPRGGNSRPRMRSLSIFGVCDSGATFHFSPYVVECTPMMKFAFTAILFPFGLRFSLLWSQVSPHTINVVKCFDHLLVWRVTFLLSVLWAWDHLSWLRLAVFKHLSLSQGMPLLISGVNVQQVVQCSLFFVSNFDIQNPVLELRFGHSHRPHGLLPLLHRRLGVRKRWSFLTLDKLLNSLSFKGNGLRSFLPTFTSLFTCVLVNFVHFLNELFLVRYFGDQSIRFVQNLAVF